MRGTKIANSAGIQSSTAVARPLGGNVHLLRNRWHMAMTVAVWTDTINFAGYAFSDGKLEPDFWGGQYVERLSSTDTDFVVMRLSQTPIPNSDPIPNVDNLLVTLSGWPPMVLAWNQANTRYDNTIPGIYAWLSAREGQVLGVRFGRQS